MRRDVTTEGEVVEAKPPEAAAPPIELVLASGDRLSVPHDAATLKLVLAVLRDQR
jgi:hypothetical protein